MKQTRVQTYDGFQKWMVSSTTLTLNKKRYSESVLNMK